MHIDFTSGNVPELFARAVRDGFTVPAFREAMQTINGASVFAEDEEEELIQQAKADHTDHVKRLLARAISENATHCGHPVQARPVYDVETGQHSILVQCLHCGFFSEITATGEHAG